MRFDKYLKDKIFALLSYFICCILIVMLMLAFKSKMELIMAVLFILCFWGVIVIGIEYSKKKKFYDSMMRKLEQLDQKYLIQEIIQEPNFYEGKLWYEVLYDIDKSMVEHINEYKMSINEFKEYVEMWIHEVKIPIASLVLLNHNDHKENKKYATQITKLDNYIDQILYYVRSENAEKDFVIRETSLAKVVGSVALKNKDDILGNHIQFEVDVDNQSVLSDAKWLEFILNQCINNSIKYKKEENACIRIKAVEQKDTVELLVYDNGIGIIGRDLSKVFEKSFTGENGRGRTKSTGMGLYIVKKLCHKLGHQILIESEFGKYTEIKIIFGENDHYKMK